MTHQSSICVEVIGPDDAYNELILTFNIKLTSKAVPQTHEQPAEGAEYEVLDVSVDFETGDDGGYIPKPAYPKSQPSYILLEAVFGPKFLQACFERACETAEETDHG